MIATPAVIKRIEEIVQSKVNEWRPIYGPKEIPEHPATPKPYSGTTITLRGNENEPIRLLQPLQGDIDDVSVLWIPSQRTLITGDLVYSGNQHVWLKEVRQKSDRDDWIESVRCGVIGGHVPVGVKPRVTDMQSTIDYIEFFDNYVFGRGYSAQEISEIIKRQYPDRLAPLLLNITAETYGQKY
ncbi:hypothetical protein K7432_007271 [Basidiobolus ranarum]|uniref:Uncharacterized protein n=1 Tax=Basidiobolus ranarum TaxID=34480 RepID=A0ABR2W0B8_9FUNG